MGLSREQNSGATLSDLPEQGRGIYPIRLSPAATENETSAVALGRGVQGSGKDMKLESTCHNFFQKNGLPRQCDMSTVVHRRNVITQQWESTPVEEAGGSTLCLRIENRPEAYCDVS